jgi:adenylate kinase/GNAT superfamily N-acetyltransferase/rRNA-processing protein FCF1
MTSSQTYLIDTNVIIGLEDDLAVQPAFSALLSVAAKHKVDVLVHEAAKDDLKRDRNTRRRDVSLSKLDKYHILKKVRGLTAADLEAKFGPLAKANDVVDATLLDALDRGAADFVVTQDRKLHERARRHSPELGRRVLFVPDAVQLLKTTYEPKSAPIRYIEEVSANEIPLDDPIFDSLRQGYPDFNKWWTEKCVRERRPCWIVDDNGLAGIVVIKDETGTKTDATIKAAKILKICTFKVSPDKRGVKLGELLLKKALWFAQANGYKLAYVTTYEDQVSLIDLLEYYGFAHTATKPDGELIYEKSFSAAKLDRVDGLSDFELDRLNYPRFLVGPDVRAFGVPIVEDYHDTLYPDLKQDRGLFDCAGQPGNTIRKVYLCRAQSKLGPAGSLLFFYKSKSKSPPSQAMTALGVFEEVQSATSTKELMQMTGGRSVYSEAELAAWGASAERPVKVINYLLAGVHRSGDQLRRSSEGRHHRGPSAAVDFRNQGGEACRSPEPPAPWVCDMTQTVVALVGVSGVGKSTVLRAVAETLVFQHLQASALIKDARNALEAGAVGHDDLRQVDIGDNQALLVEGFRAARDLAMGTVILDGHTVIDTPNGLVRIEPSVFGALGIQKIVLVVDGPDAILRRRAADTTRKRPVRSAAELDKHQNEALLAAYAAACLLGIPLHVFPISDLAGILSVIRNDRD